MSYSTDGVFLSESTPLLLPTMPPVRSLQPTVSHTISSLCSGILSTGMLFLPYCLGQSGLPLFIFIISLVAVAAHYTVGLLLCCVELVGLTNPLFEAGTLGYIGLGECVCGERGRIAVMAALAMDLCGMIMAHLLIVAETLQSVAHPAAEFLQQPVLTGLANRRCTVAVLSVLLLPVCSLRGPDSFAHSSHFLHAAISLLVLLLVYIMVASSFSPERTIALLHRDFSEIHFVGTLPLVLTCFMPHCNMFGMYSTLTVRTPKAMGQLLLVAILGCTVGYTLWAGLSAAILGDRSTGHMPTNILLALSYRGSLTGIRIAVQLLFATAILGTIPAFCCELRFLLYDLFLDGAPVTLIGSSTFSAMMLLVASGVSIALPDAVSIFTALGCSTTLLLGYILPLHFYSQAYRHAKEVLYIEEGDSPFPSPKVARALLWLLPGLVMVLGVWAAVGAGKE
mmetsp:Transcript_79857/g.140938  ORF Transcript_79857/g.140938 Transcript_79857/m.140938 type:complete len:452 (-) Transcript_79857:224-1579(-)